MADYRELLRKAVEALPENNGASRRQVYEKARSALVAQLRAINPPLPARDITQHRLQLEDCIRQVEQQATDALLGGLKQLDEDDAPDEAVAAPVAEPETDTSAPDTPAIATEPEPSETVVEPEPEVESAKEKPDVIDSGAEAREEEAVAVVDDETAALQAALRAQSDAPEPDSDVVPADAPDVAASEPERIAIEPEVAAVPEPDAGSAPAAEPQPVFPAEKLAEPEPLIPPVPAPPAGIEPAYSDVSPVALKAVEPKPGSIDYLIGQAQAAADRAAIPTRWKDDSSQSSTLAEAGSSDEAMENVVAAVAADPAVSAEIASPAPAAMSSEREVDVHALAQPRSENDPQGAIDRAIETLDREARGESTSAQAVDDDLVSADLSSADDERGGGNAVTIFLLLFVLLLAGVGGAGYWAWREGYIDLETMFAQGPETVQADIGNTETASDPEVVADNATGPGNTVATPDAVAPVSEELGNSETGLSAETPRVVGETELEPITDALGTDEDAKIEERLPTEENFDNGETAPTATDEDGAAPAATETETPTEVAVAPVGAQSLLLEASSEGTTGAVPFSGTVDWSRGADELGQPTLLATANIPARNLTVDVLIRRNADPTLPASHLMEVDFSVTESFVGGAIAGLPGILLKNEELVRGVPLVGASARVVGNSFLFALSAADQDVSTNTNLLQSRKWMDLAMVYATGNRAIITLEKDADAQVLFDEVMATWAASAAEEASASQ